MGAVTQGMGQRVEEGVCGAIQESVCGSFPRKITNGSFLLQEPNRNVSLCFYTSVAMISYLTRGQMANQISEEQVMDQSEKLTVLLWISVHAMGGEMSKNQKWD